MNKHRGSSFEDFLREEGIYEEVHAIVVKRMLAMEIEKNMTREGITKPEMARRMGTSRSQLDRVLDPKCITVQLDTLVKAARAVGQSVQILFQPLPTRQRG
jgi:antitoxin HicB